MLDLRLIGVHEDGQHLLLADPEGNRYRVPLDEALRAAARRDRPRLGQLQIEIEGGMRPREVQALIRAGASAEEVAERAGWPVEKVRRYEGPILAEREHVAGLARQVRLRGRGGGQGSTPTLATRVSQRLSGRGVDPSAAEWDSARNEEGEWTVTLTFAAGGRQRQASWHFDVPARTVVAADDEARWLSEDDQPATNSPIPAPHLVATPVRATTVYDVEAEGGVAASARPRPSAAPERPSREEPLDLMTAMRERASARGRRSGGGRRKSAPAQTPVDEAPREDALPLEEIAYDPETMPPPPAARGTHPADEPEAVGDDVLPAAEDDGADVTSSEPDVEREPETTEPEPAEAAPAEATNEPEPEREPEPEPEPTVSQASQPQTAEQETAEQETAEQETAEPEKDEAGEAEPVVAAPPVAEPQQDTAEKADTEGEKADDAEKVEPEQPKPGPARPARKKGRPSVPSWDDVVFGARPRD